MSDDQVKGNGGAGNTCWWGVIHAEDGSIRALALEMTHSAARYHRMYPGYEIDEADMVIVEPGLVEALSLENPACVSWAVNAENHAYLVSVCEADEDGLPLDDNNSALSAQQAR